ncbi:zinc finger BED domain-containing protein RICESLEEPER 3 [Canna indica]|uniref:Zinc finger BED domain-containing protein RICESLEEPER 3 n=1 Tax=Canna indica TaxID=4628 RepID=A0AAQ3KWP3_9LILI|nr:zinc finger BED domain-containing protein RICESLEEPER 3 [Canna indica]
MPLQEHCVGYLKPKLNSKKALMLNGGIFHGLRQDVPTRWNSTYLMLKGAIYYKTALEHLGMSDSNYRSCPSIFEWDRVEKLCNSNEALAIAVILDPRYKLEFVEFAYGKLYGNDGETHFSRIRRRLFDLFNEYLHKSSCEPSSSASQQIINLKPQESDIPFKENLAEAAAEFEEATGDILNTKEMRKIIP